MNEFAHLVALALLLRIQLALRGVARVGERADDADQRRHQLHRRGGGHQPEAADACAAARDQQQTACQRAESTSSPKDNAPASSQE